MKKVEISLLNLKQKWPVQKVVEGLDRLPLVQQLVRLLQRHSVHRRLHLVAVQRNNLGHLKKWILLARRQQQQLNQIPVFQHLAPWLKWRNQMRQKRIRLDHQLHQARIFSFNFLFFV